MIIYNLYKESPSESASILLCGISIGIGIGENLGIIPSLLTIHTLAVRDIQAQCTGDFIWKLVEKVLRV